MKQWRFPVALAVLVSALFAPSANALWSDYVFVSSTLGINSNRLCLGDGSRGDIGCPTYAPYVSNTGYVGIGTTDLTFNPNPVYNASLKVNGNAVVTGRLGLQAGYSNIDWYSGASTWEGSYSFDPAGTGRHLFYTHSSVAPGFSVGYTGVGIQTGSPSATLHVVGTALTTSWTGINFSSAAKVIPTAPLEVSGTISATSAILSTLQTDAAGLGQVAMTSATVTGDFRVWGNLYVSGSQTIDGVSFANGGVNATGTVTATAFSGDGSRLTNLNTGGFDDDRIISTTSGVIANGVANGGYISLTNGGATTWGYLGTSASYLPTLTVGAISASTNQSSFTSIYASDKIRIGSPSASSGTLTISVPGSTGIYVKSTSSHGSIRLENSLGSMWGIESNVESGLGAYGMLPASSLVFREGPSGSHRLVLAPGGALMTPRLGVGTFNPSASLHVSGTIRMADSGEACDTNRSGAVKWNGTQFQVCYGSGGWALLSSADVSGTIGSPDRIVSGTAQIIARNNADISVSTNMDVSGTIKLAGTGAEVCSAATIGTTRINPATGRPEYCRW